MAELESEIAILRRLEALADRVRHSGTDRKWTELVGLLDDRPEMVDESGSRRKLIVFTEHRDTLNHLVERLRAWFGRAESVVSIHGGVRREERRRIQEVFTHDKDCFVLVATDAAGEGINLQRAHLMVNYDLPWNPNRIEQRFGRVHRIGQREVCHLWNLVAEDTREGQVYLRLLDKLEEQRRALGGQVFDVLGAALPGRALRDLLIEAIRYGDQPEVRARLDQVVDATIGDGLTELVNEQALASDALDLVDVERIRRDLLEAEARRLQPHYVRAWFTDAFERLGGRMAERETGRFEVLRVPEPVRQASREAARRGVGPPPLRAGHVRQGAHPPRRTGAGRAARPRPPPPRGGAHPHPRSAATRAAAGHRVRRRLRPHRRGTAPGPARARGHRRTGDARGPPGGLPTVRVRGAATRRHRLVGGLRALPRLPAVDRRPRPASWASLLTDPWLGPQAERGGADARGRRGRARPSGRGASPRPGPGRARCGPPCATG